MDMHVGKNTRYLVGLESVHDGKTIGEVGGSPEAMLNIPLFII